MIFPFARQASEQGKGTLKWVRVSLIAERRAPCVSAIRQLNLDPLWPDVQRLQGSLGYASLMAAALASTVIPGFVAIQTL